MSGNLGFYKLNDLGTVARGKSKHRPRNDPWLYGGPYPFIQTGDVKHSNFYITSYTQTYNEKGLAQSKLWDPGTLCITIAANIADTAILAISACFPDSIIGFIPDKEKTDVRFVKYCLESYRLQMEAISQGTTQDNLSLEKLLSINLKVPSLPVQRKIAAILTAYDDLIETNKRRIALLEKMAEEIYREWFVRMRFPGHRNTKFIKGIPEGWKPMPSSDMFDVLGGGTPKTDVPHFWYGPIPFFTPKDAPDHIYVSTTEKWITDKGLNSCNSRLYPKNTIFITARGTVGKLALAQCDMAMNQSCYALVPKFDEEVFFFYLSISNAIEIIKGVSKSGVFDNIIIDTFRIIPIYFPGRRLIKKFNDIAGPIFSQLECLLSANARLAKTRDILLPRLISGKLSVADLDIQFPPSIRDDIEAPNHRE
jgi:type I restriction enzyme S subunit